MVSICMKPVSTKISTGGEKGVSPPVLHLCVDIGDVHSLVQVTMEGAGQLTR